MSHDPATTPERVPHGSSQPTSSRVGSDYRTDVAFLDASISQPLRRDVASALTSAYEAAWAHPSGLHGSGRVSAQFLEAARNSIAVSLGVRPTEVSFAGSGLDAGRRAVEGLIGGLARSLGSAAGAAGSTPRIGVNATERSSILDLVLNLVPDAVVIPVDDQGRSTLLAGADSQEYDDLSAVVIQRANTEVGTIQELGSRDFAAGSPPFYVSDISHCAGLLNLPAEVTCAFADARTWGGPGGVGIVIARDDAPWWLAGSARPVDDVSVPEAVAAAIALEHLVAVRGEQVTHWTAQMDRLADVLRTIPDTVIHAAETARLPQVLSFSCLYVDAEALVVELDRVGVCVGSGSACASRTGEPSHVLAAMEAMTHGNVRVCLPVGCPDAHMDRLIDALPSAVASLRELLA